MDKTYGLIFDMDGVIADSEAVNARATIKVFEELFDAPDVRGEDFEQGIGKGAQAYILAAARRHNIEISDQQMARAVRLREKYIIELFAGEPRTFEGALELINAALEAGNFKPAIATSSGRELSRGILNATDVPYEKMVYITGDEVENKKPDPEIYLAAARELALEPADCAVIEDAPGGVEAAKAAGCRCIAVTNTAPAEELSQADMIVKSLKDINLATIAELIGKR